MQSIKQYGFNLLELLYGLALIAILLAIAAPTYQEMRTQNQLQTAQAQLSIAVHAAKNMAWQTGASIIFCQTDDQKTCTNHTLAQYLIYLDNKLNNQSTTSQQILRVFPALHPQNKVLWKSFSNPKLNQPIHFTANQYYTDNGSFVVCIARANTTRLYGLVMNVLGRIRLVGFERGNAPLEPNAAVLTELYVQCSNTK